VKNCFGNDNHNKGKAVKNQFNPPESEYLFMPVHINIMHYCLCRNVCTRIPPCPIYIHFFLSLIPKILSRSTL
jgi:hypothetical protein